MKDTMKTAAIAADIMLFDNWFDPIEDGVRERVCYFIETMLEEELESVLSRPRYAQRKAASLNEDAVGRRHGHRQRALTGTFGNTKITVPHARIQGENGKTSKWRIATGLSTPHLGGGRAGSQACISPEPTLNRKRYGCGGPDQLTLIGGMA
ncbi:hypothetical protein [Methylosinus sporium]|uniref:hypothetical protein n=1 Tax=Methylosinus sporium TaxID=428 RepID=UPI00383B6196